MRTGALILVLLIAVYPFNLFADDDSEKEEDRPITEEWKEVLLYGIDIEIIQVVNSIKEANEQTLNKELLTVFHESVNTKVRGAILEYFIQIEFKDAEKTVLAILSNEEMNDPELMIPIIRYLSAIDSQAMDKELIEFIDSDDQSVVSTAIKALGKYSAHKAEIGKLLLEKLDSSDYPDKLKPDLILALGELKYSEATDILIDIASNRDEEKIRRMYASTSLGKIGDKEAIPVLKKIFTDDDSLIRMYAASALSNFNMKEVEDLLIQGLKDSNVKVRLASAKALAHKDAKKSVEILIYKAKYDPEKKLRFEAMNALGEIGTRNAFEFLREMYRDNKLNILYRETALNILCDKDLSVSMKVIKEVIETEWDKKNQKVLEFTAKKLSKVETSGIQETGLKSIFSKFLESNNFYIRIYGIRGIDINRLKEFKAVVQTLSAEDPHPAVRKLALSVLERL